MALFFNQRRPREFNYRPRFFDPAQEEREERKKIVLGEKYRAPGEVEGAGTGSGKEYVPGAYVRQSVSARRGNAHAADSMRRHRRKQRSMAVLVGMLTLIGIIVWMMYFR